MEDVLYDYHLSKSVAQQADVPVAVREFNENVYFNEVLERHGLTQEEFDSSLVYYYGRADLLYDIYDKVTKRLEKQSQTLGAGTGSFGHYASLGTDGDTANIWNGRQSLVLMPVPPHNKADFEIEVDTTFKTNDSFLLQFFAEYVFQDGNRDANALISIDYEGDTVVSRKIHFSTNGHCQMRFEELPNKPVKRIRGLFYLRPDVPSTTLKLLFLENIQLIRFHKQYEQSQAEPDSVTTGTADSLLQNEGFRGDSLLPQGRGDSVGQSRFSLSARRRNAIHRVDSSHVGTATNR